MLDEKDMRIKITRDELEELCKDLLNKVVLPAQRALDASGLTIEVIDQVKNNISILYCTTILTEFHFIIFLGDVSWCWY